MDGVKVRFGLLRAIRENGMRQRDFAKQVGDSESFVSEVVNGLRNLDESRREKYARFLGVSQDELFRE